MLESWCQPSSVTYPPLPDLQGEGGSQLSSVGDGYAAAGPRVTDDRTREITVGQVLSMTSGIRGERFGIFGNPTDPFHGPFEFARWLGL